MGRSNLTPKGSEMGKAESGLACWLDCLLVLWCQTGEDLWFRGKAWDWEAEDLGSSFESATNAFIVTRIQSGTRQLDVGVLDWWENNEGVSQTWVWRGVFLSLKQYWQKGNNYGWLFMELSALSLMNSLYSETGYVVCPNSWWIIPFFYEVMVKEGGFGLLFCWLIDDSFYPHPRTCLF